MSEYWITDGGYVIDASDSADYNHEGYVINSIQEKYSDGMPWDKFLKQLYRKQLEEYLKKFPKNKKQFDNNWCPRDALKELGATDEEISVIYGKEDARTFAMKNWQWKRVVDENIESWLLTTSDLSIISDGMWEIYQEEAEDKEYNIYIYSNKKWITSIPWRVLTTGNPSLLLQYQDKFAEHLSFKNFILRDLR